MEIEPGAGVAGVRLGDARAEVVGRLGAPTRTLGSRSFHADLVVEYDARGRVELIEIPCGAAGEEQVTYAGIRLTGRPLDDVVADLRAAGHEGTASDIGVEYASGFAVWSTGALALHDVDPRCDPGDDRDVAEGVSVAAWSWFTGG